MGAFWIFIYFFQNCTELFCTIIMYCLHFYYYRAPVFRYVCLNLSVLKCLGLSTLLHYGCNRLVSMVLFLNLIGFNRRCILEKKVSLYFLLNVSRRSVFRTCIQGWQKAVISPKKQYDKISNTKF